MQHYEDTAELDFQSVPNPNLVGEVRSCIFTCIGEIIQFHSPRGEKVNVGGNICLRVTFFSWAP